MSKRSPRSRSLSKDGAAAYRANIVARLEHDLPSWRTMGNAALARYLRENGIRSATGLAHDAETVRDLRRSIQRASTRESAQDDDEVEMMRKVVLAALNDLNGTVTEARLCEIDYEIRRIGLTLIEDRFVGKVPLLWRAVTLAQNKLALVPGEIGAPYRLLRDALAEAWEP